MSPNIHRSIMEKSYFVHSRTDRCQNDGGAPVPPMFSALKSLPFTRCIIDNDLSKTDVIESNRLAGTSLYRENQVNH